MLKCMQKHIESKMCGLNLNSYAAIVKYIKSGYLKRQLDFKKQL